jgi:TonB family protein
MTSSLRYSAYSLLLHTTAALGILFYCRSGESPVILPSDYVIITAVNVASENLKVTNVASVPDAPTKFPGEKLSQNGEKKVTEITPQKIIAKQRKIERKQKVVKNDAPASTAPEHESAAVVPTADPVDHALQSRDPSNRPELLSAADTDSAANIKRRGTPKSKAVGVNATNTNSGEAQYLRTNFDYIREIVMNNLSFPASAKKRRLSGRIEVSFTVGKDGRVEDIHLDSSSGHALLDMNVASASTSKRTFPGPATKCPDIFAHCFQAEMSS